MRSITFLGAGNIAQAIMGGLASSPDEWRLTAYDPVEACRSAASDLGAKLADSPKAAIKDADLVMLCVKPNIIIQLLDDISATIERQLIVSVAAGITTQSMLAHLPAGSHVVRCMPNTPALVKTGMTALFASDAVTTAERESAEAVLAAVGSTLWVSEEKDLDAVTAVSGSGPAYFFLLMETLIDAGVKEGLDTAVARQLALQTALGAAKMASVSEHDPGTLRAQVTSPGGTTQAAIESFLADGLPGTVETAVAAARKRSEELSAS